MATAEQSTLHIPPFDYAPATYPCSLLKQLDSLYLVYDTVTLNNILDTSRIVKYGVCAVDTTPRNYPNPFSIPSGFPFTVERDSDLVRGFIVNYDRTIANICLNARFPKGSYRLYLGTDNCHVDLQEGIYYADIRTGKKREWKQFLLRK